MAAWGGEMRRLLLAASLACACLLAPQSGSPSQAQACQWFPSSACPAIGVACGSYSYPWYAGQIKDNLRPAIYHLPGEESCRILGNGVTSKAWCGWAENEAEFIPWGH